MLPQTWEDPSKVNAAGRKGDNDPLDVMEIGSRTYKVGEMRQVKILGDLELIDQVRRARQPTPRRTRPRPRPRPHPVEDSSACVAPQPSMLSCSPFPRVHGTTDQGELDHKIIVIDAADPMAAQLHSAADLKTVMPGVLEKLVEWLKMYKTTDGKEVNVLTSETPTDAATAAKVVAECHASWKALKARGAGDTGFSLTSK